MSEDLLQMRTRLGLKSCLKITPPITPELSAAPSPSTSGRTSPSVVSDSGSSIDSCERKTRTVAFCSDDELEEVFWADEWDRTPAAVTPKLSYQDILELKQLRVNIPYTPPPSSCQLFTTSTPSSSKPPFPVSRFASTASHTPSKWKNRSEAQVDPEILPYLDAVPIRLLPLLPQAPTEPEPQPEPHPQTPTPTASPETRPVIQPPSEPPELRIEPATPTPPPARKPNFSFLPLLPLQDPPPIPAPISQVTVPCLPKRKFNMNFLPVNAAPEPETSSFTLGLTAREKVDGWMGSSINVPSPSSSSSLASCDSSHGAGHLSSEVVDSQVSSSTPTTIPSDPTSRMTSSRLPRSLHPLSTLPAAVESDTDTETDTYTDTDVESDAPSTSTAGSSLPSPPCEYEGESALDQDLKLDSELLPPGYHPRIHRPSYSGSYFPPVALPDSRPLPPRIPANSRVVDISLMHSSEPGQTPPLSVLYPSPTSQTQPLGTSPSVEFDPAAPSPVLSALPLTSLSVSGAPETLLSMSRTLRKKVILEALPSPALAPPSPFELDVVAAEKVLGYASCASNGVRPDATPVLRPAVAAPLTPLDSPMPTLESVRAAWDANGRANIRVSRQVPAPAVGALIAPSISRRRSS